VGVTAGAICAHDERSNGTAWLRWIVVLAILCGVFFRFYHLDRKTYWEDEIAGSIHMLGYTEAEIVQASAGFHDAGAVQSYFRLPPASHPGGSGAAATVRSLAAEDPQHPPFYYVLSHLWVERLGTSVAAIRALPALCGILALFAIYWLATELFGSRRAAWLAAALLAVSPLQVLYSQEAREYTLWTCVILASSALLLRAARLQSRPAWIAYALSVALGMYVFPLSALVAAGHGAYLLVSGEVRKRGVLLSYLAACAFGALSFLPWLHVMLTSSGLGRGMNGILSAKTSPLKVAAELLRGLKASLFDFGFFRIGPLRSTWVNALATLAAAALTACAASALATGGRRKAAAFVLVGLTFPALPLVAHDLLEGGGLVNQLRYLIPLYLAVALALAYLFDAKLAEAASGARTRAAWSTGFALVIFGGLVSCALSSQATTWWNKDYERTPAVASIVNATSHPLVVSDRSSGRLLGLSFYLDPRVNLSVSLTCDQCAISPPARSGLLADAGRYSDVFLLGPFDGSDGGLQSGGDLRPENLHPIGIKIYPHAQAPLNMFLAVN
jgi:uncharacterized membrane protein